MKIYQRKLPKLSKFILGFLDLGVWFGLVIWIYLYTQIHLYHSIQVIGNAKFLFSKPMLLLVCGVLFFGGIYLFLPFFTRYWLEKDRLVWKSLGISMRKLPYEDIENMEFRSSEESQYILMHVKGWRKYLVSRYVYLRPQNPEEFKEELERLSKPYR